MKYAMVMPWKVADVLNSFVGEIKESVKAKNKETKAEYMKRARRGMLGMAISWIDLDPFDEKATIAGGEINHANPTQKLICEDMWRRCSHWIVNTEFTWQVRMVVIFDGARETPDYLFTHTGTLRGHKSDELNDAMQKAFDEAHKANASYKDGHKNKGVYLQTEFVAQIVGV